jgi:hypothetical protein
MLRLSREGVVIMPVCPPFYRGISRVEDVTAGFAAKLLAAIGVASTGGWRAHDLAPLDASGGNASDPRADCARHAREVLQARGPRSDPSLTAPPDVPDGWE